MRVVPATTATTSRDTAAEPALAAGPAPGGQRLVSVSAPATTVPSSSVVPTAATGFPPVVGLPARSPHLRLVREAGMASAEYAVALIAACAFAAVLLAAVRTSQVMSAIGKLIAAALKVIS